MARYFNGKFRPINKYFCQDLSRQNEDVFYEIPPFAVDKKTGEFLNKTDKPIIKKIGSVNVYEKIQSYLQDCDIYEILARVSKGEESLLTQNIGSFGDFADVPDNIHSLVSYLQESKEKLDTLLPETQKALLSGGNINIEDIVKSEVSVQLANLKISNKTNDEVKGE